MQCNAYMHTLPFFKDKNVITFFADRWVTSTVVHNFAICIQSDRYLAIMITVIKQYLQEKTIT